MIHRILTLLAVLGLAACVEETPTETAAPSLASTSYTPEDQQCMAEAMYHEARGTGSVGMRAVGEVVLNRAFHPKYPGTICGVIDHRMGGRCQFSYRCDGRPDTNFRETDEFHKAQVVALELLTRRGEDITRGALYYHAIGITPEWFRSLSPTGQFGKHLFYK